MTQGPAHSLGHAAPGATGADAEPRATTHVRKALLLIVPCMAHSVAAAFGLHLIAKGRSLCAVTQCYLPNSENEEEFPLCALRHYFCVSPSTETSSSTPAEWS